MLPVILQRNLEVGLKSIWHQKLRSLLTILGVVFGVASVIAMLAIGEGASYEAQQKIKQLGSMNIIIRSVKPPEETQQQSSRNQMMQVNKYGLLDTDYRALREIPSVAKAVQVRRNRENIWHLEKSAAGQIVSTEPSYLETANLTLKSGRFFNGQDYQARKNVAVIGAGLAAKLFPFGNEPGQTVRVKNHYYRIIGVLGERSLSGGGKTIEAQDINYDLYIPLSTGRAQYGQFVNKIEAGATTREWVELHEIILKIGREEDIVPTVGLVSGILKQHHQKPDYELLVPLELLRQAAQTRRLFDIVLGSIAAISLLVGGIGIMNIMLASVMERTREIGIRRSLGAKKRDIVFQFLVEAVFLSTLGGLIGVLLGLLIPALVTHFAGMKTIVRFWSVLLSFSISAAVGVIFGLYPARRAAEMDPIAALRHE
ncbi:MAG: ABC transporter permease [Candidatus Omnitrophota bacterium]